MAIVSVNEDFQVRTGARTVTWSASSLKNVVTYLRRFVVVTNNVNDGPQTVMTAAGIPQVFSAYATGNDNDPAAYCISVTPLPRKQEPMKWDVTCNYTSDIPTPNTSGEGGNPATNPLLRGTRYGIEYVVVTRDARYDTVTGEAIVNSAQEPYPRGVEVEKYLTVATVSRTEGFYASPVTALQGKVNSNDFLINGETVSAKTALCTARQMPIFEDGIPYWNTEYRFVLDPDGWTKAPLDQGTTQLIPAPYVPGEFTTAKFLRKKICDKFGNPVGLVNLDGQGNPLEPGLDPVFLDGINSEFGPYNVYKQAAFPGAF